MMRVVSSGPEVTAGIAADLARQLPPGSVVLLYGDLGAGKTAFVRGMATGLQIPEGEVSSPTFTLVQEYRGGQRPLFHADLYRLREGEVDDVGIEELGAGDGVLAVEWAERLPRPMADATREIGRAACRERGESQGGGGDMTEESGLESARHNG